MKYLQITQSLYLTDLIREREKYIEKKQILNIALDVFEIKQWSKNRTDTWFKAKVQDKLQFHNARGHKSIRDPDQQCPPLQIIDVKCLTAQLGENATAR